MKKRNRLFVLILTLLFLLLSLVGCSQKVSCRHFNSEAKEFLRPEYLEANPVADLWSNAPGENATLPDEINVIIRDKEMLNEIFIAFPHEVDFSKENVILHMAASHVVTQYAMKACILEDGHLRIKYIDGRGIMGPVVDGHLKCIYVIVDRTDVKTASFEKMF